VVTDLLTGPAGIVAFVLTGAVALLLEVLDQTVWSLGDRGRLRRRPRIARGLLTALLVVFVVAALAVTGFRLMQLAR
jgi:hypothetical protein